MSAGSAFTIYPTPAKETTMAMAGGKKYPQRPPKPAPTPPPSSAWTYLASVAILAALVAAVVLATKGYL